MPYHQQWAPTTALSPLLSTTLSITYALYILAYPPRHRGLAFLFLCVPTLYAFVHHLQLTPWYALDDTFGRMLYIWLAYMSYALLIVRVSPDVEQGSEASGRLRWAGKVVYTRHLGVYFTRRGLDGEMEEKIQKLGENAVAETGVTTRRGRESPHRFSSVYFCIRHLAKAALFLAIVYVYDTYIPLPTFYPPASFVRRLPASLERNEVRLRAMMTWDVCISDMLYFESVYSIFAILWVGIFRLDAASEWSLSLFGPLSEAYSVRRYWGVYWHDYINASFTAHVKVVTRGWLGMKRSGVRRVVENAAVFGVSGLMHSVVRYVQTDGDGEIWTIAIWYGAQMLPIIIEGVAQHFWLRSSLRRQLQIWLDESVVMRLERTVGYAWVCGWMLWSVPKHFLTRHAWEMENLRKRYPELFDGRNERKNIVFEGSQ